MDLLKASIDLIKDLEWSSYKQGQGWGPMGSGGDGPMIPACPCCGGVNPGAHGRGHFIDSAIGHKKTCQLSAILNAALGE